MIAKDSGTSVLYCRCGVELAWYHDDELLCQSESCGAIVDVAEAARELVRQGLAHPAPDRGWPRPRVRGHDEDDTLRMYWLTPMVVFTPMPHFIASACAKP